MVLASIVIELFHGSRPLSSEVDRTLAEEPTAPGVDAFVRAVAANVRALRMQAGLTLADLAAAAGLGKSTLAQL
jgi:hypothetical protein